MRWLALLLVAACHHPIATCDDNLEGVYAVDGAQWMILDGRTELEAYPLFVDVPAVPGVEVAPRFIELQRTPSGLTGTMHRRYMQRAAICDARAPIHVTSCASDTLELVAADPAPPVSFAPCAWGRPNESQLQRWRRQ